MGREQDQEKMMENKFPMEVLNKLKWGDPNLESGNLENAWICYTSRGAPGDIARRSGKEIDEIGKSFILFSNIGGDKTHIPYHRVLTIEEDGKILYARKGLKKGVVQRKVEENDKRKEVRIADVCRYLALNNWSREEVNSQLDKARKKFNGKEMTFYIPMDERLEDYSFRISRFIESIASLENKEHLQIISEITGAGDESLRDKGSVIKCGCSNGLCTYNVIVGEGRITFCPDMSDDHQYDFVVDRKVKKELLEKIAKAKAQEDIVDNHSQAYHTTRKRILDKLDNSNKPLSVGDMRAMILKDGKDGHAEEILDVSGVLQSLVDEDEIAFVRKGGKMDDPIREKHVEVIGREVKEKWEKIKADFHAGKTDLNGRDMQFCSLVGNLNLISDACDALVDELLKQHLLQLREDRLKK